MKKILFIADPLKNINIYSDSTYLMFLTAHDMQFDIYYCTPADVFAVNNHGFANVSQVQVAHGVAQIHSTPDWFSFNTQINHQELSEFAAIFVRNDPPFNLEYYYLTQILQLAESSTTKVINHPSALRNCNEKLTILNFPDLITPTLVSKNKHVILDFIAKHGVCVAKPIDMMAGRGVFRIAADDPNQNAILESLTDYFNQTIMVQKFIPEVVQGDKRIFIINGEVVSYCLYRIPQNGQIRGNLAVGGRGEVHPLNEDDYRIANQVAQWLKEQGILIAGIDVIGKCLTEVNITSPTAMQQIYRDGGVNVAKLILDNV
ncbi:MAG: glutathione synthase [Proteobacteria bacterium]|nr:MAG: glutathione synthase [Pseudomonadota bacterium]